MGVNPGKGPLPQTPVGHSEQEALESRVTQEVGKEQLTQLFTHDPYGKGRLGDHQEEKVKGKMPQIIITAPEVEGLTEPDTSGKGKHQGSSGFLTASEKTSVESRGSPTPTIIPSEASSSLNQILPASSNLIGPQIYAIPEGEGVEEYLA